MQAAKSLGAVLALGLRPSPGLGVKAMVGNWLGREITPRDGDFWRAWFGTGSFIGKRVSVDQALQLSTVWACVRLISETLATLPFGFYQRNADGSRTLATSHNLYELLHNAPNADTTAIVFWEAVVASMLLWGNAYVEIKRSGRTVIAMHFLHPARVTHRTLAGGGREYRYRDDPAGAERVISESDMMHIPAFSTDGINGLSPIAYGVNVFGAALETDRTSAETFRDSMRAPGLVTMDAVLKPEQRDQIRAHVKKVADDGGVMVLEKGASFQKLGFDPVSAELLGSRAWNVEEIARWYRVDPSMIGHGGKDSNWGTGLEQKMIWFLTFTLRHWCVRIEQAVRKSLLTPVERMKYFAEFALEGLLRADSAARAAFFSTMTQNGIMTRDECRGLENWPLMGGNANVLTVQSNLVPLDKLGEKAPEPTLVPPPEPPKAGDVSVSITQQPPVVNHKAGDIHHHHHVNVPEREVQNRFEFSMPDIKMPPVVLPEAGDIHHHHHVNVPERESHFEMTLPETLPANVHVEVNGVAGGGRRKTTYLRDPETNEVLSTTTEVNGASRFRTKYLRDPDTNEIISTVTEEI